jgi:hypothetical protein
MCVLCDTEMCPLDVFFFCYRTHKYPECSYRANSLKYLKMARQVFLLSLKLRLEELVWCDEVNEEYCEVYGNHANLVYLGDFTPCINSCLPLEMCTFLTECTQPEYFTSNSDFPQPASIRLSLYSGGYVFCVNGKLDLMFYVKVFQV